MKKISKADSVELDKIVVELRDKKEALEEVASEYNKLLDDEWDKVEEALTEMNNAIEAAANWRKDIVGKIEEYVGDRSDAWQESDRASEYEDWKSAYEECTLDILEIERSEEIDVPEFDEEELGNVLTGVDE